MKTNGKKEDDGKVAMKKTVAAKALGLKGSATVNFR